jgi:hypothetical protein
MRLGIKDYFIKLQGFRRRSQQNPSQSNSIWHLAWISLTVTEEAQK